MRGFLRRGPFDAALPAGRRAPSLAIQRLRRKQHRNIERLEDRLVLSVQLFDQVAPIGNYSDSPVELTVSDGHLYFAGDDSTYGHNPELWRTDGTPSGTRAITGGPANFRPRGLTDVDGQLFFAANASSYGVELWTSDGTPGGTRFVADTNPNNNGGPGPNSLTNIAGTLFFTGGWWSDVELWRSDGTAEGTRQVRDIHPTGSSGPYNFVEFSDGLMFTANDGEHGYELWRSDGTAEGTILVKDIRPGPEGAGSENTTRFKMTRVGDEVFFVADDGVHGRELWRTDGTTDGTHLVVDLVAGPQAAGYSDMIEFDGALYFGTSTGTTSGLWRSDGTVVGTTLVAALDQVSLLTVVGDRLFFSGDDGQHGAELWISDGTASGTEMIADVRPGPESSAAWIRGLAPVPGGGEYAYFTADDGQHGTELWRTDGTAIGTVMLRDTVPGSSGLRFGELEYYDGYVYFTHNKGLWRTSVVNVGPPTADAGGPYLLAEGNSLSFDASATTDPDVDPGAEDVLEYAWDVNGDGVFADAVGVVPTLSWRSLELLGINAGPQQFDVRVRVRDGNGGETISPATTLDMVFAPPTVTSVAFGRSDGGILPAPGFWSLGDLPGGAFQSIATDVSSDGSVIVGRGTDGESEIAFRWTVAGGMQPLGVAGADRSSSAQAVSADGTIVAGIGRSVANAFGLEDGSPPLFFGSDDHPFRWSVETGIESLAIPEDGFGASTPSGLTADGSIIVGSAYWDDWTTGVRWTSGGVEHFAALPEQGLGGPVLAVSADGQVVAGTVHSGGDFGAVYRAEEGSLPESLGFSGTPTAMSADGNVIVGVVTPFDPDAFRWTSEVGFDSSFSLPSDSTPLDVSGDGSVVVGESPEGAFVWMQDAGARFVADVLASLGVDLGDWRLTSATGVSDDGHVLVGYGVNPQGDVEAWRADLSTSYQLAVGDGSQLAPLPYDGLDEIIVSLSEPVVVTADALELRGAESSALVIAGFHFDASTRTATWTLSQPLAADAYSLAIRSGDTGIRDVAGNALDGEWNNPTSPSSGASSRFPSGDGQSGGDFDFRFRVLPGDLDRNAVVNLYDLVILQRSLGEEGVGSATNDVNGDGVVGRSDVAAIASNFGRAIPSSMAASASATIAVAARREVPHDRDALKARVRRAAATSHQPATAAEDGTRLLASRQRLAAHVVDSALRSRTRVA